MVIPTRSPGLEQLQSQLWHWLSCPPTASLGSRAMDTAVDSHRPLPGGGRGCSRISSLCHNGNSSGEGQAGLGSFILVECGTDTCLERKTSQMCQTRNKHFPPVRKAREEVRTSQIGWVWEWEQLELGQGGLGGISGKVVPPEGVGHWTAPQGMGMAPELQECLDNVGSLGVSWAAGPRILWVQLRPFPDPAGNPALPTPRCREEKHLEHSWDQIQWIQFHTIQVHRELGKERLLSAQLNCCASPHLLLPTKPQPGHSQHTERTYHR